MMNRTVFRFCYPALAVFLLILSTFPARSEPRPFDPIGARHIGIGAASAAIWNTPESVYHNPASLVWQTLTFGAGLQPVQFTRGPVAWWFHFYNSSTQAGIPVGLIMQGWDYPTAEGTGQYIDLGIPIAFNFTNATPGAATIHLAAERRPDGDWKFNAPIDLGFLARHRSGATLGLVARGLTIGESGFISQRERVEFGGSWGGGVATLAASMVWPKGDDWETAVKRYRVGGELTAERVKLLGGYIHEPDNWYATGGISLLSDETGRIEFVYSAVYNHATETFDHFLQYGMRMR